MRLMLALTQLTWMSTLAAEQYLIYSPSFLQAE